MAQRSSLGTIKVLDNAEFEAMLRKFAGPEADRIAKKALYAGMKPLADTIRSSLHGAIKGRSTGALSKSFGVARHREHVGVFDTVAGFHGYDPKGATKKSPKGKPNIIKARVLEARTKFFSSSIKRAKSEAIKQMETVIGQELNKGGK